VSGDDLTVSILREIRDEIRDGFRHVGSRIDATNERLDATNQRLDVTNEQLEVTNQRLAVVETTVKDFAGQHLLLTRFVKNVSDRHDKAIDNLDERVEKLETTSTSVR